jgi:tRNA pseudouridine55 synthase
MENSISQNIDEVVLVDKPEGITSYDVIRNLKRKYPRKTKIGHAGTLDPFATGLLIILVGKYTKRQDEFHKMNKVYRVKAIFNAKSDTLDRTGKIEKLKDINIEINDIEDTIKKYFLGNIQQIPPKFSAVHVNGKRAYDLARNGVEFELKPKDIQVFRFNVLSFDLPTVEFEIECGSGTYIRSLVSDLAIKLGTDAYCDQLRRISIGEYNVDNAVKLED